jgi:hypothetical protein
MYKYQVRSWETYWEAGWEVRQAPSTPAASQGSREALAERVRLRNTRGDRGRLTSAARSIFQGGERERESRRRTGHDHGSTADRRRRWWRQVGGQRRQIVGRIA